MTFERNLAEFNVEGKGFAIAMDSVCADFCSYICGAFLAILCILAPTGVPAIICAAGSAIGCVAICAQVCKEYPNFASFFLPTACAVFTTVFCKMIKMGALCEKVIPNLGICAWLT